MASRVYVSVKFLCTVQQDVGEELLQPTHTGSGVEIFFEL